MARQLEIKAVLKAVDKASGPLRLAAKRIKRSLGRTLSGIGSITRGVTGRVAGLASTLGVLGGGGIIAGVVGLVKSYGDAGRSIRQFSQQVGISAQSLQELEFVANRTGISSDRLRDGIKDMTERLGEARVGAGEMNSGLKDLGERGLLRQVKNAKSTAAAFDILISRIGKIEDPAKRTRLAMVAFGEAGFDLQKIALLGEEGLRKLAAEARQSGTILGGKALEGANKFDEATQRLKERLKATSLAIGKSLIPVLEPLIKSMAKWLEKSENQEKVTQFFKDFVKAIVDNVPKVIAFFQKAATWVSNLVDEMGGLKNVALAVAAAIGVTLLASLGPVGTAMAAMAATAAALKLTIDEFSGDTAATKRINKQGLFTVGTVEALKGDERSSSAHGNLAIGGNPLRESQSRIETGALAQQTSIRALKEAGKSFQEIKKAAGRGALLGGEVPIEDLEVEIARREAANEAAAARKRAEAAKAKDAVATIGQKSKSEINVNLRAKGLDVEKTVVKSDVGTKINVSSQGRRRSAN